MFWYAQQNQCRTRLKMLFKNLAILAYFTKKIQSKNRLLCLAIAPMDIKGAIGEWVLGFGGAKLGDYGMAADFLGANIIWVL